MAVIHEISGNRRRIYSETGREVDISERFSADATITPTANGAVFKQGNYPELELEPGETYNPHNGDVIRVI